MDTKYRDAWEAVRFAMAENAKAKNADSVVRLGFVLKDHSAAIAEALAFIISALPFATENPVTSAIIPIDSELREEKGG